MAEGKSRARTAQPAQDTSAVRLAQLEASVSSLALALMANGIEVADGADPCTVAIIAIKRSAEEANDGAVATLKAQLEELRKDKLKLEIDVAELQLDLQEVTNQKNTLANRLAEEGKPSGIEKPADPVRELEPDLVIERPDGARDAGPEYGTLPIDELVNAIEAAGELELVFSNGKWELLEFSTAPIIVRPKDLNRLDPRRVQIKQGVDLKGSSGRALIHGCALLMEGMQVAYHTFNQPLAVNPNEEWRLHPVFI